MLMIMLMIMMLLIFLIIFIIFILINLNKNIEKFNLNTRTYAILGDEPWIWYKFEDLNNLTIIGNVGLSGVSIRGTNSVFINNNGLNSARNYIQIPSSIITSKTQLNEINTSSGISISFWFYLTNDTIDYARIFYLGNYSQLGLYDNTYNRIQISTGTKSNTYLSFNIYNGNNVKQEAHLNPVYNNWRHIVWTISNQGIWNIYIDNVKKTNNFGGFVIPRFTSHITFVYALGTDIHFNNYGISGYLDDFRIYRRVLNDGDVNELYTSSATNARIEAENARIAEGTRVNNFRNQKKEELRQLKIKLERKQNIINNPPNQALIDEYNSQINRTNTNLDGIQNTQEMTNIINSVTQSVNNLIGRIDNLINSTRTTSKTSLNTLETKLNSYESYIRDSRNNDFINANNSIRTSITTFKNNVDTYLINKIETDLTLITNAINNLITSIEKYKRDLLISSARTSINQSLRNLQGISNIKTQVNFGTFNNEYNDIDSSITAFIGSLSNSQTDANNLGVEITRINGRITTLKDNINSLKTAREDAIINIDLKDATLDNLDFIANKNLINDNSLNISYNNLKTNINDLRTSLNTFTTGDINSKLKVIDRDYLYVKNQVELQSTKIKALNLLSQAKIDLNNLRAKIAEVPQPSLRTKFDIFLKKIDDYYLLIDSSISINDIDAKKIEIDTENKALVAEINSLYEKEMKRRRETIQDTLYNDKERGLLNSPIENFRIKNRRFEYEVLMINYSGEGNTEMIVNDVIFGNHFKRRIGGIEIRYSSRVSVENNPSRLLNGSLRIDNNSSFKIQGLPKIVMNGEEIRGEFISFKYNRKFVLKKYGFRMSEDWKKAVGLWELYYLNENDVYKLLDSNEVRLTKEDYNKTDMEDGNHFIKFLDDNDEKTNEILIIFTGKIESDDKDNGIHISQLLLYEGTISNVESTCKSIEEIRSDVG